MRTVYIDSEYRCHTAPGEGLMPVQEEFFEGKCTVFVEGYRLVPQGSVWQRSDGKRFAGPMIAPWKDPSLLAAVQAQYELDMAEAEAAYQKGVNSV